MRLIFACLAVLFSSGASAQTLPGPEDYEAAVVSALSDSYAYCTTHAGGTAASLSVLLEVLITLDFPDARDLEREVRMADAAAAVDRLIGDGTLIADAQGIRLPECAMTDRQIAVRLGLRTRELQQATQEERIALLSGAMAAFGCSVTLAEEATFVGFAIRHVAGLYDIPLPDPLPQDEDPTLTPFVDTLGNVFNMASAEMGRAGLLATDDGVVRLVDCTPTGMPPETTAVSYGTDPVGAAEHVQALEEDDLRAILAQSYAAVGCSVPYTAYLFQVLFDHNVLRHVGVDLPAQEFAQAYRDLAVDLQTDHPYGDTIAAIRQSEAYFSAGLQADMDGLLNIEAADARAYIGCTPTGDLSVLDGYAIE